MHPIAPVLCATLPAAACVAAHYFPWRRWYRRGRLPRVAAYVFGVLAILLPATVAAQLTAHSADDALALLWLAALSAAAGTLIPWCIDAAARREYAAGDELDRVGHE